MGHLTEMESVNSANGPKSAVGPYTVTSKFGMLIIDGVKTLLLQTMPGEFTSPTMKRVTQFVAIVTEFNVTLVIFKS